MYDYASAFTIIYKRKSIFLLHREFDHILNMQRYVTHNFHGQKMDVGFNLALFIFHPQLFRRFSEKETNIRQVSRLCKKSLFQNKIRKTFVSGVIPFKSKLLVPLTAISMLVEVAYQPQFPCSRSSQKKNRLSEWRVDCMAS